jgi:hypothetical protein
MSRLVFRERHLEVLDQRTGRKAHSRYSRRSSATSACANAVPHPYHAGSRQRFLRPREHPRNRPQPAGYAPLSGRRAGARPDRQQGELVDRGELPEERNEAGLVPDERPVLRVRVLRKLPP